MESSDHIRVKHWKAAIPRERNLGRIYEKPMADRPCARIGGMGAGTIRIAQMIVGWTQRKPWDPISLLRFRPDTVLHRLAFSEQVRHTTKIGSFKRTALCFDP